MPLNIFDAPEFVAMRKKLAALNRQARGLPWDHPDAAAVRHANLKVKIEWERVRDERLAAAAKHQ